eukprot:9934572-Ditylum_brightwellii.AAC.1
MNGSIAAGSKWLPLLTNSWTMMSPGMIGGLDESSSLSDDILFGQDVPRHFNTSLRVSVLWLAASCFPEL